jgi:hypothetical protein
MSKNKYQSLADASRTKEQEKSEALNPQSTEQPAPEIQAPKMKSPLKLVLIWFTVPILMVALSALLRGGCQ